METLVLTSHGTILQIGEGVVKDFFLARGNFLDKPPSQREVAPKGRKESHKMDACNSGLLFTRTPQLLLSAPA